MSKTNSFQQRTRAFHVNGCTWRGRQVRIEKCLDIVRRKGQTEAVYLVTFTSEPGREGIAFSDELVANEAK